jgi:spore germination protein GerM
MVRKKNQKGGSKAGMTAAIWILAFLILLVLFIILLPRILDSLKQTDFFSHLGLSTPKIVAERTEPEPPPPVETQTQTDVSISVRDDPPAQSQSVEEPAPPPVQSNPERLQPTPVETPKAVAAVVPSGETQLKIWFVEIQSDGTVSRKEITRGVAATDAPLTAAITALLLGPNAAEKGKGCDSLIPQGTRLLGASVKNGVATINFSDEFQYNRFGVEGYMGQLMQIVYTATAFPTVDSVQFLVEGAHSEYIGSEGVWIGSPLSRSTFR